MGAYCAALLYFLVFFVHAVLVRQQQQLSSAVLGLLVSQPLGHMTLSSRLCDNNLYLT